MSGGGNGDEDEATQDAEAPAPAPTEEAPDELREQLAQMREEADRIAALDTGGEQVEAAERFAEAAGALDERMGAAARDADDDRGN